jgi:excisionase family DNA binding protein
MKSLVNVLPPASRGLTPREVAKLLRISRDRVVRLIRNGTLGAINNATARCGKARFIILPSHLDEYCRRHAAADRPKAPRQRKPPIQDYFPDL